MTFFWLVSGEVSGMCSRNLMLSLKLLSSTSVGVLVLQKNSKISLNIFLEEEPGPFPKTALLFREENMNEITEWHLCRYRSR